MNNKIQNIQEVNLTSEIQSFIDSIQLDPNWISGFIAGEGSFIIIQKNEKYITSIFSLCLTTSDQHILYAIWVYFGKHGNVYASHNNTATLSIFSNKGIRVLIDFFDKYPILGNKALDYVAFREIAILKERSQHLTKKGYQRCIELYINQNTGRNYFDASQRAKVINNLPEIPSYAGPLKNPADRKLISLPKNTVNKVKMDLIFTKEKEFLVNQVELNPNWISGLTAGEGCFFIGISPSKEVRTGFHVKPQFKIS